MDLSCENGQKTVKSSIIDFWLGSEYSSGKYKFRHVLPGQNLITSCKSFAGPLRKKCPNAEFFWSIFSCIWTKNGDLRSKYPYSVQIREISDQKKLRIWTLFRQWTSVNYGVVDYHGRIKGTTQMKIHQ